jgi:hypothetical protein
VRAAEMLRKEIIPETDSDLIVRAEAKIHASAVLIAAGEFVVLGIASAVIYDAGKDI